ncbi:methyltransferase [Rheinheimera sp.]|uniref:methyltransferase n=1 Tax=Rheinheimera sp. TaxID=1869214 RepID=UPI0027B9E581|nr:methyltransferase [Rheinheimera sp.]
MLTDDLKLWFFQLDQLLLQLQPQWRLQPMQAKALPFADAELNALLLSLSLEQCDAIDQNPVLQQHYFAGFFPLLFQLMPQLPFFQAKGLSLPFWLSTDIGGRKWQQISLFAEAVGKKDGTVLEWCAGKGHLGKVLCFAYHNEVRSLEWQAELCQQGQQQADKLQLKQNFIEHNVLQGEQQQVFSGVDQLVALHACGDLHRVALQAGVAANCAELHLLPCCYHLQQGDLYQPLSQLAAQSQLKLTKQELKLSVQGHNTGGERVRRLRHTEVLWRRAYQLWHNEQTGSELYQPLASTGKHWFSGEFAAFAKWAASQHQLHWPVQQDGLCYLQQAQALLLLQRRIELVQHLFRRPLELWLVLDRALYLVEQGYQVQLQQLCEASVTPRNLLISAYR